MIEQTLAYLKRCEYFLLREWEVGASLKSDEILSVSYGFGFSRSCPG